MLRVVIFSVFSVPCSQYRKVSPHRNIFLQLKYFQIEYKYDYKYYYCQ